MNAKILNFPRIHRRDEPVQPSRRPTGGDDDVTIIMCHALGLVGNDLHEDEYLTQPVPEFYDFCVMVACYVAQRVKDNENLTFSAEIDLSDKRVVPVAIHLTRGHHGNLVGVAMSIAKCIPIEVKIDYAMFPNILR